MMESMWSCILSVCTNHQVLIEAEKSIKPNIRSETEQQTLENEEGTEVEEERERIVLVSTQSGIILSEDYESLAKYRELTTGVVLFVLNELNESYGSGNFCVVDSFLMNYALDYNNLNSVEQKTVFMELFKERVDASNIIINKTLIVPVCHAHHFTLFVVDQLTDIT